MGLRNGRLSLGARQLKETYPSLTGLRFIAALAVVFAHSIAMMVKWPDHALPMTIASLLADCGMSLFFILSGFVIHANYGANLSTPEGLWNFFVARFARLYPLYFIFVCYDLLMKLGFHQTNFERLKTLPFYITLTQSWIYFPLDGNALIYQFGLAPQVTWSISTEWFFYLAFPFLCLAGTLLRHPRSVFLAMLALSLSALALTTTINLVSGPLRVFGVNAFGEIAGNQQDGLYRWIVYFSPYVRIFEFALGCLISTLVRILPAPTAREQQFGAQLLTGAFTAIGVSFFVFGSGRMPSLITSLSMNFGFAPLLATIIFCCARYDNRIVRVLSSPRIVLGGETSYSIYLSHIVVIGAFRYEAPAITDPQILIAVFLQVATSTIAIIGLSLVLWSLVEIPVRRYIRCRFTIQTRIAQPVSAAAAS